MVFLVSLPEERISIHFVGSGSRSRPATPTLRNDGTEVLDYSEIREQGFVERCAAANDAAGLLHHCPNRIEHLNFRFVGGTKTIANLDKTKDAGSVGLISGCSHLDSRYIGVYSQTTKHEYKV